MYTVCISMSYTESTNVDNLKMEPLASAPSSTSKGKNACMESQ